MRPDDDELELLRREARAIGMPGTITPASAGIESPTTAADVLARIKARQDAPAEDEEPESDLGARRRRRRVATRVLAAAAAVAGVVGIMVAPWQQPSATAATPPVLDYEFANAQSIAYAPGESARSTLLSLAQTAEGQPTAPRNGSTQYLLTENWFATLEATKTPELIPKRLESWLRADGSVRVREAAGPPLSPDGRGLTTRAASGQSVTVETYPPTDVPASLIDDLDRSDVRTALLDSAQCPATVPGPDQTACLVREIIKLHDQFVIPADLSAEFWEVLADESSVRLLGAVTDRAGRAGVGISLIPADAPQFRLVLIISPTTGKLLGTEDILIKDDPEVGVEAPAIYSFTAIMKSEYTDARGPRSSTEQDSSEKDPSSS
ncbi:MAG: CU044_5270 family protein [Mycetocola sp.]